MTPEKWNDLFTEENSVTKIRITVGHAARQHLATLAPGMAISTNELGEALYPRAIAEQSRVGDDARKCIFKLLYRLALDGLEDCCVKGEITGQFMGHPKRPWIWFCPADTELCYACGQVVIKESEAAE